MKKTTFKTFALSALCAVMFTACDKGKTTDPVETKKSKYVLMTQHTTDQRQGWISAFDEMPSGEISNIIPNQSLGGTGMAGWRPYNNLLLKMFNSTGYEMGIEQINVSESNVVSPGKFIKTSNTRNGSGNFTIVDDKKGFYWDGDAPLKIQIFNPSTMQRTGEIDLTDVVNERGKDEAGILYRSVGQKLLAVKNGKLFANITYAKGANQVQWGFFDDFYNDVYIAVIDIATEKYEKTTKAEDTGSIAYINDNSMYSFDTNNDLYIVTQGRTNVGGKSKIIRIKANETEVDKTWEVKMDDLMEGGKFVTIYATNGHLITTKPTEKLSSSNINLTPIWEFNVINVANKQLTKIAGVPLVTNPGAGFATVKVDDKLLLRVNGNGVNGYYQLNSNLTSASPLFNVKEGGSISGFHKIEI